MQSYLQLNQKINLYLFKKIKNYCQNNTYYYAGHYGKEKTNIFGFK